MTLGDPQRLAALAESGLLSSSPEEAFDRITRLVAEVLHVPVALFTLVTAEQQVFKSSVGVGELRSTPLSHSFCRHVVDSGAPLEVVDARVHPKVRDNPAIEDHGIVSYLGMPLVLSTGERLGALCAIDHEPRQWTGRDHGVLEDLASAAMAEVELRRANRAVAAAAAELHFAATHDSLTRLGNRRALLDDLGGLLADGRPASFALFDLHGMRGFNDAHGHIAGDELLASLANRFEVSLDHHSESFELLNQKVTETPIQTSLLLRMGSGRVSPFLLGGPGWYRRKVETLDSPGDLSVSSTEFGWHAGIGLEALAGKHFGFHGDYRYTFLNFHDDNNPGGLVGRVLPGHRGSMWTLGTTFYF